MTKRQLESRKFRSRIISFCRGRLLIRLPRVCFGSLSKSLKPTCEGIVTSIRAVLKGRAHKVSGLSGDLVTLGKVARRNTDAPFSSEQSAGRPFARMQARFSRGST